MDINIEKYSKYKEALYTNLSFFPMVSIEKDDMDMCKIFSEKMNKIGFKHWIKRSEDNSLTHRKASLDNLFGKIGEFVVYRTFKKIFGNKIKDEDISLPDCKIYNFQNKNFEPDLFIKNSFFCIKTYRFTGITNRISWVI